MVTGSKGCVIRMLKKVPCMKGEGGGECVVLYINIQEGQKKTIPVSFFMLYCNAFFLLMPEIQHRKNFSKKSTSNRLLYVITLHVIMKAILSGIWIQSVVEWRRVFFREKIYCVFCKKVLLSNSLQAIKQSWNRSLPNQLNIGTFHRKYINQYLYFSCCERSNMVTPLGKIKFLYIHFPLQTINLPFQVFTYKPNVKLPCVF